MISGPFQLVRFHNCRKAYIKIVVDVTRPHSCPLRCHGARCLAERCVYGIYDSFLYPAPLWRPQGIFPGSRLPVRLSDISSKFFRASPRGTRCIYTSVFRHPPEVQVSDNSRILVHQGQTLKTSGELHCRASYNDFLHWPRGSS